MGANGDRLSLTEGTGRVVDYTYDDLYRLLTETVTDAVTGNHFSQWSYDPVGNRLQQDIDGVLTLYTYDVNDHLLTETENGITTTYVYDDNGNTLEKVVDGLVDTTYSYSKDNRMLTADTGTSSISYTYDAGGIRQSQTVDGQVTNFLIDPNRSYHQVLEEQDSLFLPQVTYTYGDDLINQTNSQGVHIFGYDGLGSTRILTDSTGAVQNSYGYQAFGELDYEFGTIENSYLFTGEQYDNNVGFYYLRARFYNPEIGRFQNMDTFPGMQFEPLSLHKYLYTHADPINNIDPSGNVSIAGLFAGAAIGVNFGVTVYNLFSIAFSDDSFASKTKQLATLALLSGLGAGASKLIFASLKRLGQLTEKVATSRGKLQMVFEKGKRPLPKEIDASKYLAETFGVKIVLRGTQEGADMTINGLLWELKTLNAATSNAVANNIRKSLAKNQSRNVIIDGRIGINVPDVIDGIARARRNGHVASRVRVMLGDGRFLEWEGGFMRQVFTP